jgi:hypothetical protein
MSCLMISVQLRIVGNSCHLPGIVGDVPALGQVEEDEGRKGRRRPRRGRPREPRALQWSSGLGINVSAGCGAHAQVIIAVFPVRYPEKVSM